jgi:hypothetical protein
MEKKEILEVLKDTKDIMNEVKNRLVNEKRYDYKLSADEKDTEIEFTTFLAKQRTNLPCNLLADDSRMYIHHNHPLWIYVQPNYGTNITIHSIPMSVCSKPQWMASTEHLLLSSKDVAKVKKFIIQNELLLKKVAIGEIDSYDLLKQFIPLHRHSLLEMGNIYKKDTKLPVNLWLDDKQKYIDGKHGPRIKFQNDYSDNITNNFLSLTITDPPKVKPSEDMVEIEKYDLNTLKDFVINNIDILLNLANKKIYMDDALPRLDFFTPTRWQKEMEKGLENKYHKIDSEYHGWSLCMSETNDLYNFQNGKYDLLTDEWFINAKRFDVYPNGIFAKVQRKDEKWCWIDTKGNITPIRKTH